MKSYTTSGTDYIERQNLYTADDTSDHYGNCYEVTYTGKYDSGSVDLDDERIRKQEAAEESRAAIPRWRICPPIPPELFHAIVWAVNMGRHREWTGRNFKAVGQ